MAGLKLEIVQERAFASLEEEALLKLLRASDCLNRALHRETREWGVTSTQYNVLRILRGAHPGGLTCSAIGSRMITAEPDITRLLARLKALKLIRQQRDTHDRRVLWTTIAEAGLALLKKMDPVILRLPAELLGRMNQAELAEFIRLLELARGQSDESKNRADCDGREVGGRQKPLGNATEQSTASGRRASEPSSPHPHRS